MVVDCCHTFRYGTPHDVEYTLELARLLLVFVVTLIYPAHWHRLREPRHEDSNGQED